MTIVFGKIISFSVPTKTGVIRTKHGSVFFRLDEGAVARPPSDHGNTPRLRKHVELRYPTMGEHAVAGDIINTDEMKTANKLPIAGWWTFRSAWDVALKKPNAKPAESNTPAQMQAAASTDSPAETTVTPAPQQKSQVPHADKYKHRQPRGNQPRRHRHSTKQRGNRQDRNGNAIPVSTVAKSSDKPSESALSATATAPAPQADEVATTEPDRGIYIHLKGGDTEKTVANGKHFTNTTGKQSRGAWKPKKRKDDDDDKVKAKALKKGRRREEDDEYTGHTVHTTRSKNEPRRPKWWLPRDVIHFKPNGGTPIIHTIEFPRHPLEMFNALPPASQTIVMADMRMRQARRTEAIRAAA